MMRENLGHTSGLEDSISQSKNYQLMKKNNLIRKTSFFLSCFGNKLENDSKISLLGCRLILNSFA